MRKKEKTKELLLTAYFLADSMKTHSFPLIFPMIVFLSYV